MKLTTMKISMSVLMLMMFQSGHGARITAADWEAFDAAARGDVRKAIDHVSSENSGFKVKDAKKVSDAFEAAIDSVIREFAPKALAGNADFVKLVHDAILGLDAGRSKSDLTPLIENALREQIVAYFADEDAAGWWKADDADDAAIVNWCDAVAPIFNNSGVPALGGEHGDVIDAGLLGNDGEHVADHSIKGFIADFRAAAGDNGGNAENLLGLWNTFVNAGARDGDVRSALGADVNDLDFLERIRAAVNAQDAQGAPEGAAAQRAVYDLLAGRAKEVRKRAFQTNGGLINVSDDEARHFVEGVGPDAVVERDLLVRGLTDIVAERAVGLAGENNADADALKVAANNVFRFFIDRNVNAANTNPVKGAEVEFFNYLNEEVGRINQGQIVDTVRAAARRVLARNVESFLRPNMAQNMDNDAVARLIRLAGIGADFNDVDDTRRAAVEGLAGTFNIKESGRIVRYLKQINSLSNK